MSQKLPKWLRTHVQKCRVAFGIDDVHQRLYINRLDEVAHNANVGGETRTTPRYIAAVVNVRRDLEANDRGYEDLTHELLHAAMPLQLQAVQRIIELLPKEQQAHAWEVWTDANEATVTRLARGLAPLLRRVRLL